MRTWYWSLLWWWLLNWCRSWLIDWLGFRSWDNNCRRRRRYHRNWLRLNWSRSWLRSRYGCWLDNRYRIDDWTSLFYWRGRINHRCGLRSWLRSRLWNRLRSRLWNRLRCRLYRHWLYSDWHRAGFHWLIRWSWRSRSLLWRWRCWHWGWLSSLLLFLLIIKQLLYLMVRCDIGKLINYFFA